MKKNLFRLVAVLLCALLVFACNSNAVFYTVSYETNGGSYVASQQVVSGGKATRPADPTREGYIFVDWFTDAEFTEIYDFNTEVKSNKMLYAKWIDKSVTSYVVTFDSNGGTDVLPQIVAEGECAVKPVEPTKSGCTFVAWCSDVALLDVYNFKTPVTDNITLYAKWIEKTGETVKVTYYPGEGTGNPVTVYVEAGYYKLKYNTVEKITSKALDSDYTEFANGTDSFLQWEFEDGKRRYDGEEVEVTENIELTATWITEEELAAMGEVDENGVFYVKGSADVVVPRVITSSDNQEVYVVTQKASGNFTGSSLTLPPSVEEIPNESFNDCSNLKTVTFSSTEPPVLYSESLPSTIEEIIPPAGCEEIYKEELPEEYSDKVKKVSVVSVVVKTAPERTLYLVDKATSYYEPANYSGLVVSVLYSDETTKTVEYSDATKSKFTFSLAEGASVTAGQTVTVWYTEDAVTEGTTFDIRAGELNNYTLKPKSSWFDSFNDVYRSNYWKTVTEIHFTATKPDGVSNPVAVTVNENVDPDKGTVGYVVDGTKIYVVGERIMGNPDSERAISRVGCGYWDCYKSLVSVDFENFDTSNVANMSQFFMYCSELKTIDHLNELNTSNVTNMGAMFYDCDSMKSIIIDGWNTSSVTDMSYFVAYCDEVEYIYLDIDTSNVWDFMYAFGLGAKDKVPKRLLETIRFGEKWSTSSCTRMLGMFASLELLEEVDVSNWDTSKVTEMSIVFSNCCSLTELNVSSWDTSKVTNMREMFAGCSSLTSLDMSSWDTSKVGTYFDKKLNDYYGSFYGMFSGCSSLTSLDLSKWDASHNVSVARMFKDCSSLKTLNLGNFDTSKVGGGYWDINKSKGKGSFTSMFDGCSALTTIYANTFVKGKYTPDPASTDMFKGCTSLKGGEGSDLNTSKAASETSANYATDITRARIDCGSTTPGYFTGAVLKVTYDGNGADNGKVPNEGLYTYGMTATVSDNTGYLNKACYAFDGWNTRADGKGIDYAAGDEFGVIADTVLYAKWLDMSSVVGFVSADAKTFQIVGAKKYWQAENGKTAKVEWSADGKTWTEWTVNNEGGTLPSIPTNPGTRLYLRGSNVRAWGIGDSKNTILSFKSDSNDIEVSASGNIMGLLNYSKLPTKLSNGNEHCFDELFANNGFLTDISKLSFPATELSSYCYRCMFKGCSRLENAGGVSLTGVPDDNCYSEMFSGCSMLGDIPTVTINNIVGSENDTGCCFRMFYGCNSIGDASVKVHLTTSSLSPGCYGGMFENCLGLTKAPELPAENLCEGCYDSMFKGCVSLVKAPDLLSYRLADNCYFDMFDGCSKLASVTVGFSCEEDKWPEGYTDGWLTGVAASGTFTCPSDLEIPGGKTITRSANTIPVNWTVVNPETPQ